MVKRRTVDGGGPRQPSAAPPQSLEDDPETLLKGGLKLAHVRMMVALAETGQVSTAAQVMNITQPAASRMIAEMEAVFSAKLCERHSRGMALTPYGQVFARRARSILLELRETQREIGALQSGQGGTVVFGAVTAPAIELAVPAIRRIRREHPGVEITVEVDTSAALAGELLASRHDFIIARIPDDLNPRLFENRVIGVERACLIVRRGHPLMKQASVPIETLSDYEWVMQPRGSLLRRVVEGIFLAKGIALPERILNTASSLLTLVMVAQSDAVAPIARDVAQFVTAKHGLGGSIDVLPTDFEINVRPYSLITARNRTLSPAAQMLYDAVAAQAQKA